MISTWRGVCPAGNYQVKLMSIKQLSLDEYCLLSNTQDLPTLLVFCKKPKLNQGKQRLAATLGAQVALAIAEQLLACALEDARQWQGAVVLSPSSKDDQEWAAKLLPDHPNVMIVAQPDGNLGERINIVDHQLRAAGHTHIVTIGTDAPILSADFYQQVILSLNKFDIVLSAAEDGGVTLMASSSPWPDISALPWSTDSLCQALYENCKAAGQEIGFIDPSYDIDVEADLQKLVEDLKSDRRPARRNLYEQVCEILSVQCTA